MHSVTDRQTDRRHPANSRSYTSNKLIYDRLKIINKTLRIENGVERVFLFTCCSQCFYCYTNRALVHDSSPWYTLIRPSCSQSPRKTASVLGKPLPVVKRVLSPPTERDRNSVDYWPNTIPVVKIYRPTVQTGKNWNTIGLIAIVMQSSILSRPSYTSVLAQR